MLSLQYHVQKALQQQAAPPLSTSQVSEMDKVDGYLQSNYKLKVRDMKHQQRSRARNSPVITSSGGEDVAKFPNNF